MLEVLRGIFNASNWTEFVLVLVDISIVFFIIYRVLLLIKGTRAVQMLIGLLAITIAFFISKPDFLNLPTLNWLLDTFLGSFFLIIVVIFQDDIRRVLSRMGQAPIFSGLGSRSAETQILEEIVAAAVKLAEEKTGALIVLQREADLSSYTERKGAQLDARLTTDLLVSLFQKNSPLHDGAVIVNKDRILAAGCVLPLSNKTTLNKGLGTRHRAALGLSEESDAAIVVVSEETGTISLAYKEGLTRDFDAKRLRERLQRIFSPDTPKEPGTEPAPSTSWWRALMPGPKASNADGTPPSGSGSDKGGQKS